MIRLRIGLPATCYWLKSRVDLSLTDLKDPNGFPYRGHHCHDIANKPERLPTASES
jgi:hypothetical protein